MDLAAKGPGLHRVIAGRPKGRGLDRGSRPPTPLARLVAWITSLLIVGATASGPFACPGAELRRSDDSAGALRCALIADVALVATSTVAAPRGPVAIKSRPLDPFLASATQNRLIAARHGMLARRPARPRVARVSRATLVGVVEFRI